MLIGKAANLNESQIQELAKLQRGVAAIYQNEWIEPVLCHIEPHERGLEYSPTQSKHSAKDKASSEELRYLNSCVLNPFKLDEPREYNFCDCVHKMDIPDSMKARLIEMARTPLSSRKPVVPEFLRTLVFARPRGDDQFADCTFSPSLDMSR